MNLDPVSVDHVKIKDGMGYEALVAQLQSGTKFVLCVEDGVYLRIFEESGPFPLGVQFEHKQKRYGATEYFFRYASNTEEETVMCVFGRDNAETFCPDYIDDQDTDSENTSENVKEDYEMEDDMEDDLSEVFSTSSEEGSSAASEGSPKDLSMDKEVKNLLNPEEEEDSLPQEKDPLSLLEEVLEKHETLSPYVQVIEIDSAKDKEELHQEFFELS